MTQQIKPPVLTESQWHGQVPSLGDIRANVRVLAVLQTSDGRWHVAFEYPRWSGLPEADVWPDVEVIPYDWFEGWFRPGWVTE